MWDGVVNESFSVELNALLYSRRGRDYSWEIEKIFDEEKNTVRQSLVRSRDSNAEFLL